MKSRLANALIRFALALFVILVFSAPAMAGTTYYVKPGGDNGLDGLTEANAWATLTYAIATVVSDDTIRVKDNGDDPAPDFTDNLIIPAGKEITITAYPLNANDTPARVMAANSNLSVFTINANNVYISGLEIYGATGSNVAAIDVAFGVSGVIIKQNKCGFGPGYKNKYGVLLAGNNTNLTIEDNICSYNTDSGIFLNGSYGNTVQNNTCNYNTVAGIAARNGPKDNFYLENTASHNTSTGIDISDSTQEVLWGNTVEHNGDFGISLGTDAELSTVSGNKARYNDPDGDGVGVGVVDAASNMVSQNEIVGNYRGVHLYGDTGQYNTFAGNTVSSNKEAGIFADSANPTANNWFYYNFLFSNGDDLNFQANAAGNDFITPTPWGYWFDTGDTRSSALGNYHSSYGGADANGDGIGDSDHTEGTPATVTDTKPLMYKADRYDLQTWFASGDRMYKGDQSRPGEIVALNDNVAVYFTADVKAAQDVVFDGNNAWSGRFWLTENMEGDGGTGTSDQISFTIGYTSDPSNPGVDFDTTGPNGTFYGNGATSQFASPLFAPGTDYTVPAGKYLCLRLIMNDNVGATTTYNLLTGGGWLYATAPKDSERYGPFDLYVSPTGNDATGSGTYAAPWRTIGKAVTEADEGQTIYVMDDGHEDTTDYTENVIVNKAVTIQAYDDDGTAPQMASDSEDHAFNILHDDVTIRGLDIYGANNTNPGRDLSGRRDRMHL